MLGMSMLGLSAAVVTAVVFLGGIGLGLKAMFSEAPPYGQGGYDRACGENRDGMAKKFRKAA